MAATEPPKKLLDELREAFGEGWDDFEGWTLGDLLGDFAREFPDEDWSGRDALDEIREELAQLGPDDE